MLTLQFHWYGFWVGLGLLLGFTAAEQQLKKCHLPLEKFWRFTPLLVLGAVIGARAWHVLTDLTAYAGNWWAIFAVWQGGLSIIGAVLGSLFVWGGYFITQKKERQNLFFLLDAAAFGLPVGQAIGRLGNAANQELYGLPSHLPWAIFIDSTHRYPGFQQFATYHPLFAYEAILLLGFWLGLQWLEETQPEFFTFGFGRYFCCYLLFYAWIRLGLDFLRIDKVISPIWGLGVNQLVLLVVGIICLGWFLQFLRGKYVAIH